MHDNTKGISVIHQSPSSRRGQYVAWVRLTMKNTVEYSWRISERLKKYLQMIIYCIY